MESRVSNSWDRSFMTGMVVLGSLYIFLVLALLESDLAALRWSAVREVMASREILAAMKLSLITSILSVILSLLMAIPAGYLMARYPFPGLSLIDTILDIPIVLPPLVVGVSLLIFFQTSLGHFIENKFMEFVFAPAGIVLAQTSVACAFAIRTMKTAFEGLNPRQEQVALTLGCSRARCFFRVILPQVRHAILAAGILTWARSIGEFGPILIFCGATRMKTEVLSTSVYLELSVGRLDAALAVSVLLLAVSLATLLLFRRLGGRVWV
jgi:molybdate transport system permease protein